MCKSIGNVLKKIVKAIAPILAIALLAFAVYAIWVIGPAALSSVQWLAWMPTGVLAMSGTTAGYIALGASLLVDSSAAADVAGSIAEGVGEVAGAVVTGVGGGLVDGIASGIASGGPLTWLAIGLVAWWLLSDDEENVVTLKSVPDDATNNAEPSGNALQGAGT